MPTDACDAIERSQVVRRELLSPLLVEPNAPLGRTEPHRVAADVVRFGLPQLEDRIVPRQSQEPKDLRHGVARFETERFVANLAHHLARDPSQRKPGATVVVDPAPGGDVHRASLSSHSGRRDRPSVADHVEAAKSRRIGEVQGLQSPRILGGIDDDRTARDRSHGVVPLERVLGGSKVGSCDEGCEQSVQDSGTLDEQRLLHQPADRPDPRRIEEHLVISKQRRRWGTSEIPPEGVLDRSPEGALGDRAPARAGLRIRSRIEIQAVDLAEGLHRRMVVEQQVDQRGTGPTGTGHEHEQRRWCRPGHRFGRIRLGGGLSGHLRRAPPDGPRG